MRFTFVHSCFAMTRTGSCRWKAREIGQLIARAVEASAIERRPWYEPMEKLPQDPLINGAMVGEFDTLVVELPPKQESLPTAGQQLLGRPSLRVEASLKSHAELVLVFVWLRLVKEHP